MSYSSNWLGVREAIGYYGELGQLVVYERGLNICSTSIVICVYVVYIPIYAYYMYGLVYVYNNFEHFVMCVYFIVIDNLNFGQNYDLLYTSLSY